TTHHGAFEKQRTLQVGCPATTPDTLWFRDFKHLGRLRDSWNTAAAGAVSYYKGHTNHTASALTH
ncbi:Hypothetical predicted protein, partial [Pelobates cultripes]